MITTRCALLLTAMASPLFSQTATDPNLGSQLNYDDNTDSYSLSWWGTQDHSYFIQVSDDLKEPWEYVPIIESGNDEIIQWGFQSSTDKFFVRLKYSTNPTVDPYSEDFDGDGVSNYDELAQGTDPFNNIDTDGDGLSDDYELFLGTDPNDFYNGDTPKLIIISGSHQIILPGEIVPTPLTVRVTNSDHVNLPNAPVRIEVISGPGSLVQQVDPQATQHTQLDLRANYNGQIHPGSNPVYFKAQETVTPLPQFASIRISAGSAEVVAFMQVAEGKPPSPPWNITKTDHPGGGYIIGWNSRSQSAEKFVYEEKIDGEWVLLFEVDYDNLTSVDNDTRYEVHVDESYNLLP